VAHLCQVCTGQQVPVLRGSAQQQVPHSTTDQEHRVACTQETTILCQLGCHRCICYCPARMDDLFESLQCCSVYCFTDVMFVSPTRRSQLVHCVPDRERQFPCVDGQLVILIDLTSALWRWPASACCGGGAAAQSPGCAGLISWGAKRLFGQEQEHSAPGASHVGTCRCCLLLL